jgi:hypothetical protein
MNPPAESGSAGPTATAPTLPGQEMHGEKRWTRSRWLTLVVLVFAAHLGLLYAFGARKPVVPREAVHVPLLKLADHANELIALENPTLFALPRPQDFQSVFRAPAPAPPQPLFRWTEPSVWLPPSAEGLGAVYDASLRTNPLAGLELQLKPGPMLSLPALPIEPVLPQASTLQIADGLAQRPLLAPLDLPSWPYADVLEPSVVQAVVDAAGNTVSLVLLPPGSGWDRADRRALELARGARFAPGPRLTVGRLIFRWRTLPVTATNAPPDRP